MSEEGRAALVPMHVAVWLITCLQLHQVFAYVCGQCIGPCDEGQGVCPEGCQPGWTGPACLTKCSGAEGCQNPCGCQSPCQCDRLLLACNQSLCQNGARKARSVSVDAAAFNSDSVAMGMTTTIISLVLVAAAIALCVIMRNRPKTHALRGRVLSLPCCAYCPRCRDWLQKKGRKFGIWGFQLGAKDSLDTIAWDDEFMAKEQSAAFRQFRRQQHTIVGVRAERLIVFSAGSGYLWKKKWRDRKAASKQKRKLKHEERKKRRLVAQGFIKEDKRASIILPPTSFPQGRRGSFMPSMPNMKGVGALFRRGSMLPKAGMGPAGPSSGLARRPMPVPLQALEELPEQPPPVSSSSQQIPGAHSVSGSSVSASTSSSLKTPGSATDPSPIPSPQPNMQSSAYEIGPKGFNNSAPSSRSTSASSVSTNSPPLDGQNVVSVAKEAIISDSSSGSGSASPPVKSASSKTSSPTGSIISLESQKQIRKMKAKSSDSSSWDQQSTVIVQESDTSLPDVVYSEVKCILENK